MQSFYAKMYRTRDNAMNDKQNNNNDKKKWLKLQGKKWEKKEKIQNTNSMEIWKKKKEIIMICSWLQREKWLVILCWMASTVITQLYHFKLSFFIGRMHSALCVHHASIWVDVSVPYYFH